MNRLSLSITKRRLEVSRIPTAQSVDQCLSALEQVYWAVVALDYRSIRFVHFRCFRPFWEWNDRFSLLTEKVGHFCDYLDQSNHGIALLPVDCAIKTNRVGIEICILLYTIAYFSIVIPNFVSKSITFLDWFFIPLSGFAGFCIVSTFLKHFSRKISLILHRCPDCFRFTIFEVQVICCVDQISEIFA